MSPDRLAQINAAFDLILDHKPEDRHRMLEDLRRQDPGLCQEVEKLLQQSTGTWDFGVRSATPVIGRYHLLEKIGEGGMGEVWLAEQKEPVRRRVALKLVKSGMNTREVIARFESERQALALMEHPSIAKVFDAGSTPEGAPYFVMEYVAGVPITAYCDSHRLTTRERLELFMHVCEGVQHAHQKAIIHRDLKPSNILVTEVDSKAAPKIIDFGVAKALTQKLTADTMFTRAGALIGTPEYMSPEQASSSGEDIDTRTDVYSLGIIFYELLAGAPPIELQKVAFEEFLRRLREDEPPKPSTKIRSQDAATSTDVAHKRQTEPLALAKQIRGDLDSIALKALEKERARRYGSPSDFAADIARYLKSEPVLAVPPSIAYRARKFARRYRGALVTACVVVLLLVAAMAVIIRQSIRANSEAAIAEAVNNFLQNDLLAQASAFAQLSRSVKPDPDLKVRTTLDRAATRVTGKFDRQPEVEASIRNTIGQTYIDLGLYPEAKSQLERALQLRRRVLGPENPKTLQTMGLVGGIADSQGNYREGEALLSQALEIQRRVLGPTHPDTLRSMRGLAGIYESEGKYPQAVTLYGQTVEIQRRVLGPDHRDTLFSMSNMAYAYYLQGMYKQAEALASQTVEIQRRVLGPDHPDTLGTMGNLASAYSSQGKYAQAETLDSQSLLARRRVFGPENDETLSSMANLASDLDVQGKFEQAEALNLQTLEVMRRTLGSEHPKTIICSVNLANCYLNRAKYAAAEALFSETLKTSRRVLGPEHPLTLSVLSAFGFLYQRQGKYGMAETHAAGALTGRRHALGPDHPDTMASASDLALAYVSQGKFAEAEPLAHEVVKFDRKTQPDDWQRFFAESLAGASLAGQKKYADAEPLLVEGYRGMEERKDLIGVPSSYYFDRASDWTVKLYQAWGKPEKAAEFQNPAAKHTSLK